MPRWPPAGSFRGGSSESGGRSVMMQTQTQTLRVAETEEYDETASGTLVRELDRVYEDAAEVDLHDYGSSYSFPRFISAVCKRAGLDLDADDARLVDEIHDPDDVHFGILLALPDESLLLAGSDPTAKDSIPWFTFVVKRHQPMLAPRSAQEALDMLKPPTVQSIEHEDDWLPNRHGEWWLLPTNCVPAGTIFTPGVQSTPYGPSPLGNHVPREYAFTVSDHKFMEQFHTQADAPETVSTPPEAIDWAARQQQKPHIDDAPTWTDIRELAGDVLVRGTVRHRDNDHFVENLGEVWHKAQTHDVEVYTGDEVATDIHLDYHGR